MHAAPALPCPALGCMRMHAWREATRGTESKDEGGTARHAAFLFPASTRHSFPIALSPVARRVPSPAPRVFLLLNSDFLLVLRLLVRSFARARQASTRGARAPPGGAPSPRPSSSSESTRARTRGTRARAERARGRGPARSRKGWQGKAREIRGGNVNIARLYVLCLFLCY